MDFQRNHKPVQLELRRKILELHYKANAGHIGCSLSCIDILIATLILQKTDEDSFILSKGHAASALYASLNHLGEISDQQLNTYYKNGTTLPAHPAPLKFPGIPFATGSLGHGFPVGAGIAKAKKISGEKGFVYVVMSDGETNEGTTWEAIHFSVKHKLDNLILVIDKNKLQGFGSTQNVLGDTSAERDWAGLGFEVSSADGHDVASLAGMVAACKKSSNDKPKVIIADTVKGKGISFMENRLEWHYLPMSADQYKTSLAEIEQKYS